MEFLVIYKMLKDPLEDEEDRQNILLPSFRRKKAKQINVTVLEEKNGRLSGPCYIEIIRGYILVFIPGT